MIWILVPINTAIYYKARGIGFAIPINTAKRIVSDLIRYGEVIPAWIGITVQDIDADLARYLKASAIKGALIKKAEKTGPASKAGIREGDITLAIGTRNILSEKDFQTTMSGLSAGEKINIKIWRDGKIQTVVVKTSIFPIELALDLAYNLINVFIYLKICSINFYYRRGINEDFHNVLSHIE